MKDLDKICPSIKIKIFQKLAKDFVDKIFFKKVDVCDYEALKEAFKYVDDTFGGLDVLINNAGILRYGNILESGDDHIDGILRTIDVNFGGVVRCCRLGFESMKNKEPGYIINVNSVDGHYVPMSFTTNTYCGTKFATTALTETLRHELILLQNSKVRITVNDIIQRSSDNKLQFFLILIEYFTWSS